MAEEQGKETRTGQWPTLNIERIYSTTLPAGELAQALAEHFRAKEFEAQVFRASGDRTATCLPCSPAAGCGLTTESRQRAGVPIGQACQKLTLRPGPPPD